MKKLLILLIAGVMAVACSNGKHAEFEKNTEAAKAYFKLHESENAEEMFTYLSEDLTWHMPAYGMEIGGTEEVKAAINSFLVDGKVIDVFYVSFQIN